MAAPKRTDLCPLALATLLLGAVHLASCALPQTPTPRPLEISGVLSGVDPGERSFSLASPDRDRHRAVFWDDSTRFVMEGVEVEPSKVGAVLGESVAVLAVPIGGRMVANTVALPDLERSIPAGLGL